MSSLTTGVKHRTANAVLGRVRPIIEFWSKRSLIERFTIAGGAVMVVVMIIGGTITSSFLRSNVLYHRAVATALFVDSAIVRHLGSLQSDGVITPEAQSQLDNLIESSEFADQIPYLEIWNSDGMILYSNTDALIGRTFELPRGAHAAFEGRIAAAESDLGAAEHTSRYFDRSYIEIYTPVRNREGEIIAVSEVHEASSDIGQTLWSATIRSWASVGFTCLAFFLALFTIVWRASRKLELQERSLSAQLLETQALAEHNRHLGDQALSASRMLTEHNDHFLSAVGADLHDGPSQLISFALLKVEKARRAKTTEARNGELLEIETNLISTLNDIRNIAHGLVLPAIDEFSLSDVVDQAIGQHRERTGMAIDVDVNVRAVQVGRATKICVFRFLQEGLNNAFRHGASRRARVEAVMGPDDALELRVISRGKASGRENRSASGIGLEGLRARVDALGGTLQFTLNERVGVLEMTLDSGFREAHD